MGDMPWPWKKNQWKSMAGNGGSRPGAGRPKGRRNQRTIDGEAYARALVEDAAVRARLLAMAQEGTLSPELVKTFLAYAFGKPAEVIESGDSDTPRTIQITF
jgi:hypothetical protein